MFFSSFRIRFGCVILKKHYDILRPVWDRFRFHLRFVSVCLTWFSLIAFSTSISTFNLGPLRLGKLHDLTTDLAKRKVVIEGSIGIGTGASQNDNQYI